MTTDNGSNELGLERLTENLQRVEALTQRLLAAVSHKKPIRPALQGPGQDLFAKAATAYVTEMMSNPSRMIEQQIAYWGQSLQHFVNSQNVPADRRFSDPLWNEHPYFNFIKQQYLLNTKAMETAVAQMDNLDTRERQKLDFFSRQIMDMFSPSNFLGTNPQALARAVETDGESLVRGLENLVRDIEANNGDLMVTLADQGAFDVGSNIATTPGKVVFRNHLFELIQYSPTTQTVQEVPLVIFPPWINKFYIMDLRPENSLVKWIVDQGFTLFVVSWVNPDPSMRNTGVETYIEDGFLAAIEQVKKICDVPQVNATGYCIGGTTLSLTLALLAQRGDTSVKSATLFTTLTDFSDQGEMSVFLGDDFVDGIAAEVEENGILDKFFMSRTFSFLRSNDLIYGPAIRHYMMGETPPAFDLLYWNGDGTNLPGRMAIEYLRRLCQKNQFADGGFEACGALLQLSDIAVPVCAVACETDHIAAWAQSYRGVQQMTGADRHFILAESGHVAGIINPPQRNKYGYYTHKSLAESPEDWQSSATYTAGSWWPAWKDWLMLQSGNTIGSRSPKSPKGLRLGNAPGQYVLK
ncbi:MAG: class I poly(R)-hydroxyalkanoic acid synthase [Planktomarina sp.]|uniref:PHA/PHB synthase family protein n=1 Tax=Planktomarina sp. TaxID=2024851 RepID=UPI0032604B05|nr:class I poly(R)-hydroxyalkanoic acid synthase [Planktomarina sp.]